MILKLYVVFFSLLFHYSFLRKWHFKGHRFLPTGLGLGGKEKKKATPQHGDCAFADFLENLKWDTFFSLKIQEISYNVSQN